MRCRICGETLTGILGHVCPNSHTNKYRDNVHFMRDGRIIIETKQDERLTINPQARSVTIKAKAWQLRKGQNKDLFDRLR